MEKESIDELERGKDCLKSALDNLEKSIKTSANRLYLAAERTIVAYLFAIHGKAPKNHGKIWKSARQTSETWHTLLKNLYDLRLQADYGAKNRIIVLTKEALQEYMPQVQALLDDIEKKLLEKEKEPKKKEEKKDEQKRHE